MELRTDSFITIVYSLWMQNCAGMHMEHSGEVERRGEYGGGERYKRKKKTVSWGRNIQEEQD